MYKPFAVFVTCLLALTLILPARAQQNPAVVKVSDTLFDPIQSFSPMFTSNSRSTRTADGRPGSRYWQNQPDYRIKAIFDTGSRVLQAEEIITYHNNSPETLPYIWVSLLQNRFRKDSRTTALTPLKGSRFGIKEYTDGYSLQEVSLAGAIHNPLSYHIEDAYMKVELPVAIRSQDSCRILIRYKFKLPENGSDFMGVLPTAHGSVFEFCAWYPSVIVYDDLKGWNISDHGYYEDPGHMDYSITVPAGMYIGGSGQLQNPGAVLTSAELLRYRKAMSSDSTIVIRSAQDIVQDSLHPRKGTVTWHFKGDHMNAANWAASSSFIWDGARAHLNDNGHKNNGHQSDGFRSVFATSLYPLDFINSEWKQATAGVIREIEAYSRMWYPYPFPCIVNVGGLVTGLAGAGISFISASSGFGMMGLTAKTNHEIGHSWFPFVVSTNGLYLWMQEGLNSFINDVNGDSLPCQTAFDHQTAVSEWLSSKIAFLPLATPYNLVNENAMALVGYVKPAIALRVLRNDVLGPRRFDAAFRGFIHDWAFRHPSQEDFFRYMNNAAGEDLSWFWQGWFLHDWKLDQRIRSVQYTDQDISKGIDVTIVNAGKMPMPVWVEIRQLNGGVERFQLPAQIWSNGNEWSFRYPSTSPVHVTLDPDRHFPDQDRSNNIWDGAGLRKRVKAGLSAIMIRDRYLTAIGGRERLNDLHHVSWRLMDPSNRFGFYWSRRFDYPASFQEEVGVQNPFFPYTGINSSDTGLLCKLNSQPIQPDSVEKERLRYGSLLFPELEWDKAGYQLVLDDSTIQINGSEAYRITVTNRCGDKWDCYFDIGSGLKIRELRQQGWAEGIPADKMDFIQYENIHDILLPHTIIFTSEEGDRILRTTQLLIE